MLCMQIERRARVFAIRVRNLRYTQSVTDGTVIVPTPRTMAWKRWLVTEFSGRDLLEMIYKFSTDPA